MSGQSKSDVGRLWALPARTAAGLTARAGLIGLLLCATSGTGCQHTDDPRFNPYAPTLSDTTVFEATDDILEAAHATLDNLDRRVENIVY